MKLHEIFLKQTDDIHDTLNTHLISDFAERKMAVIDWVLNSPVNDTIVYYVGYLAKDRDPMYLASVWPNTVGRLMWFASITPKTPAGERHMDWGQGLCLVSLTQIKIGPEKYLYRATKIAEVPVELRAAWKSTLNIV